MLARHLKSLGFQTAPTCRSIASLKCHPLYLVTGRAYAAETRTPESLVMVEHSEGQVSPASLHAFTAARALSQPVCAVLCSAAPTLPPPLLARLGALGAREVHVLAHASFAECLRAEVAAPALAALLRRRFTHVLAAHTAVAKDTLPRAAALLDAPVLADVVALHDARTATRPVYAGNALCKVAVRGSPAVTLLTVRTTAFPPAAAAADRGAAPAVHAVPCDAAAAPRTELVARTAAAAGDLPDLDAAKTVVAGGRGLKSAKHFELLYALARKLNGAVGASRAAVDAGYVDNALQIGQTGKVVAPTLYIGVGISGAIQHLAGMKDAKVICAINNDPDAPIFQVADYGLVADLFEAVPEMTQKL